MNTAVLVVIFSDTSLTFERFITPKIFVLTLFRAESALFRDFQRWKRTETFLNQSWSALNISETSTYVELIEFISSVLNEASFERRVCNMIQNFTSRTTFLNWISKLFSDSFSNYPFLGQFKKKAVSSRIKCFYEALKNNNFRLDGAISLIESEHSTIFDNFKWLKGMRSHSLLWDAKSEGGWWIQFKRGCAIHSNCLTENVT